MRCFGLYVVGVSGDVFEGCTCVGWCVWWVCLECLFGCVGVGWGGAWRVCLVIGFGG